MSVVHLALALLRLAIQLTDATLHSVQRAIEWEAVEFRWGVIKSPCAIEHKERVSSEVSCSTWSPAAGPLSRLLWRVFVCPVYFIIKPMTVRGKMLHSLMRSSLHLHTPNCSRVSGSYCRVLLCPRSDLFFLYFICSPFPSFNCAFVEVGFKEKPCVYVLSMGILCSTRSLANQP